MLIPCIFEHNGNDTLLWAEQLPGSFTRGKSLDEAKSKMDAEIRSFCKWAGKTVTEPIETAIVQEKESTLQIRDADSDVLFDSEKEALTEEAYLRLKALTLRSATDFYTLYQSIPDKNKSAFLTRTTFYGNVPRTAKEMYEHTKNVNEYYFAEIEVDADNEGTIVECRQRGFEKLELKDDYLRAQVFEGSYGEDWTLPKVLRRFLWHDRIHAKAMVRMARAAFPGIEFPDVFGFRC